MGKRGQKGIVMNKKMRLPKDGLIEPEDRTSGLPGMDDGDDVEGHGLPVTAPPSRLSPRMPGTGGENIPTDTGELTGD